MLSNEELMLLAIEEAEKAQARGEIPVGAVISKAGEVIASAGNTILSENDPTGHAEINAIRKACAKLGSPRLTGCNMYVTLEPCPMCSGAIVMAKLDRLFIGARDPKTGGCVSLYNIVDDPRLNHRVRMETGLLEEKCSCLLTGFFTERRMKQIDSYRKEENRQ